MYATALKVANGSNVTGMDHDIACQDHDLSAVRSTDAMRMHVR